jgi:hypothetical protein
MMANGFSKLIWTVLCGTALGLGGCYDSGDQTAYGPPPDVEEDSDVDAADVVDTVEEEMMTVYGPAPEYGPPSP